MPLVISLLLLLACSGNAQLRKGDARDLGMSPGRLQAAAAILAAEVEAGKLGAASILVLRRGQIVLHQGFGKLGPGPQGAPVQPDSVYLLASITKPVAVSALLLLVDRGQVRLDDPVVNYLPAFQGPDRAAIRVRDLLSHISGLPDMLPQNIELRRAHAPLSRFVEATMTTPLLYPPRQGFQYQSMGTLLAGEIVERLTKQRLRDFIQKQIFRPLGMRHSSLGLAPGLKISDTVWCDEGPHPNRADSASFGPNSPYWRDMGHPWGGMHSTTTDLALLLQTFLQQGKSHGRPWMTPASVTAMTTNQNSHLPHPWGLGWALGRSTAWMYFGDRNSPRTFGHSGATGTVAWANPDLDLITVILTNRPVSADQGALLSQTSNAVLAAVER